MTESPLSPVAYLPGPGGPQPCPDLLTAEEAVRYLRLDLLKLADPLETLARYRAEGRLRGTQVGRAVRYRRIELERFLDRQTDLNPR